MAKNIKRTTLEQTSGLDAAKKLSRRRLRRWLKPVIGTVLLVAAVLAVWFYYSQPKPTPPPRPAPAVQAPPADAPAPLAKITDQNPTRIKIDKAEVDARILPVGVTETGAMAALDSATDVGWYHKSAKLGSNKRAMLLDGHYGLEHAPQVFRGLTKLKVGDEIEIFGAGGGRAVFKVSEVERLPREEVDMEKAFNYGGDQEALSLITCIGNFINELKTYDDRYIVYATRAE